MENSGSLRLHANARWARRLDELRAAIPVAERVRQQGRRRDGSQPSSTNTYGTIVCVHERQERWMLSHTLLWQLHMWPAGSVSEGSANKGILPLNLPSSRSAFRNVPCDVTALESGCRPAWDSSPSRTHIFYGKISFFLKSPRSHAVNHGASSGQTPSDIAGSSLFGAR